MRHLLQPTAKKLNAKDLTRLLTPQFSEEDTTVLILKKSIPAIPKACKGGC